MRGVKTEQWKRERIRELYPNRRNKDIAEELQMPEYTIYDLTAKMGVRKSPAFRQELGRKGAKNLHKNKEVEQLSARRRMETLEKDRRRWLWGYPQKTRIHFSTQTPQKRDYRKRMRRIGYIEIDGHKNRLYYDDNTQRGRIAEEHAARHNIKIYNINTIKPTQL